MSWEKALEELGQIARLEVVLGKRVGYEKWRDASRDPKSPIFIGLTSFRRFGLGRESSSVQLQTLTCWIIFNVNEFVRDVFVAVGKLALRLFFLLDGDLKKNGRIYDYSSEEKNLNFC